MKQSLFWLALFFIPYFQLFCQTLIPDQSHVSGIWDAAHSPYLINGEAIVPENETLLIEPGVRIEFKTGENHDYVNPLFDLGFLRIQGTLQVTGKPDSLVVFSRQGDTGNWGLLFFDETAGDSSFLRYCKIEYASHIKYLQNWLDYFGALSVVSAPIRLENCQLSNNFNDGLYIKSADVHLINCLINDNLQNGLRCLSECDLQITNCTVASNGQAGLDCGLNSQPQIRNSIFYANKKDFEVGKFSLITIDHCLVQSKYLGEQVQVVGKNFLGKNPQFVDIDHQTYNLAGNSWAVNSGIVDTSLFEHTALDLQGQARVAHGRIDLGALERKADFLRLEQPNGNESLLQNAHETIRWAGSVGGISIDYSSDAGSNWTPITSIDGNEKYFDWSIPVVNSEQCLLRLTATEDPALTDVSDTTFIISDHIIVRSGLSVSGRWPRAGSPVEIRGAAFVEKDSSLEIEAGVEVLFPGGSHFDYSQPEFDSGFLQVNGHLTAIGSQNDSIIFTTNAPSRYWAGLIISDPDSLGSTLKYVRISRAYRLDSLNGQSFNAALSLSGAATEVQHCRIADNAGNGVQIQGAAHPLLAFCTIENNVLNGIVMNQAEKFPQPELKFNTIRFNGRHGIFIDGIFQPSIHDNLISHQDSTGIKISSGFAVPQIVNNRLGYQTVGIYCDQSYAKLVGNVIYHCTVGLELDQCSPDIGNLTLADNNTAIWCSSTSSVLTNILFAANNHDFSFLTGDNSAPTISYSLTDHSYFPSPVSDVGFTQYATKTNFKKQWPHYYALASGAKAIDRGTTDNSLITLPATDVAGKPRLMDGNRDGTVAVDIGAYEFSEIKAGFKASPTAGKVPLKVNFTDQSTGDIAHWLWDFGDGQTDTVANPIHIYQQPGHFDVTLIVNGPAGADTLTRAQYIYSKFPPYVCRPAGDLRLLEDADWHLAANLDSIFCDQDSTSKLNFSAKANQSNILQKMVHDSLFIKGKENFFGQAEVYLTARDQIGLTAKDTFQVRILPVNDPPFLERALPDSLIIYADSSAQLMIWDYFEDLETADSLLTYQFWCTLDSLEFSFEQQTGMLRLFNRRHQAASGWFFVQVWDDSGSWVLDSLRIDLRILTHLETANRSSIPQKFYLSQNFPNPFNPVTRLEFGLPVSQQVEFRLFDIRGVQIKRWRMGKLPAGRHQLLIDSRKWSLASGLYFLLMQSENFRQIRKIILIK